MKTTLLILTAILFSSCVGSDANFTRMAERGYRKGNDPMKKPQPWQEPIQWTSPRF